MCILKKCYVDAKQQQQQSVNPSLDYGDKSCLRIYFKNLQQL